MRCVALVAMAFSVVAVVENSVNALEDDSTTIQKIRVDWAKRREAVGSVRYRARGTLVHPRGTFKLDPSLRTDLRSTGLPEDYSTEYSCTLLIDFRSNRFRFETVSALFNSSLGEFHRSHDIRSFDGDILCCFMPSVAERRGTVYSNAQADFRVHGLNWSAFNVGNVAPLVGHGYVIDFDNDDVYSVKDLRSAAEAFELIPHASAMHNGRRCVVLRTVSANAGRNVFKEFWVDPSRDSAVLSVRKYGNGRVRARVDIEYEERGGHWCVSEWTSTEYGSDSRCG